jgi:GntR family transcriptional regulator/MocR family aminotransferase
MVEVRTSASAELLVELRRDGDGGPLHSQLERELRRAVRSGRLRPGSALPSTRSLAAQLGVSRGVVVEAYEQLVAEGYLTGHGRSATRVARKGAQAIAAPRPVSSASTHRIDFRPGRPDVTAFPRSAWMRAVKRVLNDAPSERLSYPSGRGLPELREALAAYLNRVRGTQAHADHVVVSNGFSQGLALLATVLRASGARRLAVEDPSHDGARATIRNAGLDIVPVPVDGEGLRVEALERARADAVLVTPAHQYPTGGVLPAARRAALIDWARRRNALIVEDDYDAEYRYDREPIGCIQGLAPEDVVYGGSASKTLAPGLRLGWLVVPGRLVEAVADAKLAFDNGSPTIDQLAFADFLSRGEQDRHLRRMRPIYRGRRDALKAALRQQLPALEPCGSAAGLHLLAWLPPAWDEAAVVAAAAQHGIGVYGLSSYWEEPGSGAGGLIFGYAGVREAAIEDGIRTLAHALHTSGIGADRAAS